MLFELRVLTGLNMGAAFPLTKETYVISNDVNADIYIKMSADKKPVCTLNKHGDGWLLDDPVSGNKALIYRGNTFKIQDDYYVIKLTTDDWDDELFPSGRGLVLFRTRRSIVIILNVVLFVLFLMFATQYGKGNDGVSSNSGEITLAVGLASEKEAVVWFRKILRDYELHQDVKIVENADSFVIEGELLFEQINRKNKAVKLYQEKFKKKIYDKTNVREASITPFDIKQVVSSNPAHVVTVDNEYIFVGDELDGWRLRAVNMITADFEKIN